MSWPVRQNRKKCLAAGEARMAIYSGMLQALKGELLTALGSQEKVGGGGSLISASAVPIAEEVVGQ